MNCVKIEGFEYLAVNTGYTFRLLNKVKKINEELENLELEGVLYIEDSIWGKGVYELEKDKSDEIACVRGILGDMSDGAIVMKCSQLNDAFCIIQYLMEFNYCGSFQFTSLIRMEIRDKKVLLIEFDCESG